MTAIPSRPTCTIVAAMAHRLTDGARRLSHRQLRREWKPYADLYRQSLERFNKPSQPIGIHSPGHVAGTDEQAKEDIWPHYKGLMNRIGAERGWSPIGRAHFEREAGPEGALFVGSPETVAAKIVGGARRSV